MYVHVQPALSYDNYIPVILKNAKGVEPSGATALQAYFPAVSVSTVSGNATLTEDMVLLVIVWVKKSTSFLYRDIVTSETHVSTWHTTVRLSPIVWFDRSMFGISDTISNGSVKTNKKKNKRNTINSITTGHQLYQKGLQIKTHSKHI